MVFTGYTRERLETMVPCPRPEIPGIPLGTFLAPLILLKTPLLGADIARKLWYTWVMLVVSRQRR
jgi:hypothetical protein